MYNIEVYMKVSLQSPSMHLQRLPFIINCSENFVLPTRFRKARRQYLYQSFTSEEVYMVTCMVYTTTAWGFFY